MDGKIHPTSWVQCVQIGDPGPRVQRFNVNLYLQSMLDIGK